MAERIRQWVLSGRFERQANNFFDRLEKPITVFLAFAAGYFAFAVQRMFQG